MFERTSASDRYFLTTHLASPCQIGVEEKDELKIYSDPTRIKKKKKAGNTTNTTTTTTTTTTAAAAATAATATTTTTTTTSTNNNTGKH